MKRIILFLMVAAMSLTSCSDFLDPESKNEYIPRDVASLNTLLIGYEGGGSISSLLELLSDDIACQPLGMAAAGETIGGEASRAFEMFTWQPDYWDRFAATGTVSEFSFNIWANVYNIVLKFNAVLDYIDKVDGTDELRNYVKGQALALRSYYYFWLANIYCAPYSEYPEALGLVLKLESAAEPDGLRRSTVAETYGQIVKDLLEAEYCFENTSELNAYNMNYRLSLPAVRLLLSRVYLYMENWTEAAKYATKVVEDDRCRLLDLNEISFDTQFRYPDFHSYKNPEVLWVNEPEARPQFTLRMYSTNADDPNNGNTVFRASDDLVSLFDENDLRSGLYLIAGTLAMPGGKEYPYYRPYSKFAISDDGSRVMQGVHYGSLRFVEAYINRAEANAMLYKEGNGEMQIVLDDLKEVWSHRFRKGTVFVPELGANPAEDLVRLVREERRREFCFEKTRWFDLRRYGMPEVKHVWCTSTVEATWITYTLTEKDFGYTLPLPAPALENNRLLDQNPLAPRREN